MTDIVINSENDIFFSSEFPNGVFRSKDNGQSFELLNQGLIPGPIGKMCIDTNDYIYVSSLYVSNYLAKSVSSTITYTSNEMANIDAALSIFPNPFEYNTLIKFEMRYAGNVSLKLYDYTGRRVWETKPGLMETGRQSIGLTSAGLKPGIYMCTLEINGGLADSKKMVLQ